MPVPLSRAKSRRLLAYATAVEGQFDEAEGNVIRKLKSGQYRLYSRKIDPRTGKRRNLGTFNTREEAERHERAVQFFKRRHQ